MYPKGKGLDQVRTGADLFALPSERREQADDRHLRQVARLRVAREARLGSAGEAVPRCCRRTPTSIPGEIIEKDLAQGKIDAAIVWGPIAGYYAKRVRNVELAVIPLKSEPGVKFDYEIAMGVRYGEREWKATVQKLISENQAAITAILREYGVPLVNERGELIE